LDNGEMHFSNFLQSNEVLVGLSKREKKSNSCVTCRVDFYVLNWDHVRLVEVNTAKE
jgi:hypothetical protein